LEGWAVDPRPLRELPWRSSGKSVHLNRPCRGQISGFGLPLTAVTKNQIENSDRLKVMFANTTIFGSRPTLKHLFLSISSAETAHW